MFMTTNFFMFTILLYKQCDLHSKNENGNILNLIQFNSCVVRHVSKCVAVRDVSSCVAVRDVSSCVAVRDVSSCVAVGDVSSCVAVRDVSSCVVH